MKGEDVSKPKKSKSWYKNTEPKKTSDKITVERWKYFFDKARGADRKIRWEIFEGFFLCFDRANREGTLSDQRILARLAGENPLIIPLIKKGYVDTVRIQPIDDDEPIFCFTKKAHKPEQPEFVVWKGRPASKEIADKVTSKAIEIPIKLLKDSRAPFRSDSPMRAAITALKNLDIIPNKHGGDHRKSSQKESEQTIVHYCINQLTQNDHLPTVKEVTDWLGNEHRNYLDEPNVRKILERIIPQAIESIIRSSFQLKYPAGIPTKKEESAPAKQLSVA